MKRKKIYDPYAEILDRFNRKGIHYVIVGMSGINYYALETKETFTTQDFDIFVKPTIENVKQALFVFEKLGYNVTANQKKVKNSSIKNIVREKKTILANDPYGIAFDLILAVSGFTFSQMASDATIFRVGNIPIKVAKINKLLLSKKIAGRERDKLFLSRYEILLRERAEA